MHAGCLCVGLLWTPARGNQLRMQTRKALQLTSESVRKAQMTYVHDVWCFSVR